MFRQQRSAAYIAVGLFLILQFADIPPAAALDSVILMSSNARLTYDIFQIHGPTPSFWTSWDEQDDGDTGILSFRYSESYEPFDYYAAAWSVHFNRDCMGWDCSWAENPHDSWFDSTGYDAFLAVEVRIFAPLRLVASRYIAGDLAGDEHTIAVRTTDGDVTMLLGDSTGPDNAELELEPGTYWFELAVDSRMFDDCDHYESRVHLIWEPRDEVPVESTSWSRVKSLFQ